MPVLECPACAFDGGIDVGRVALRDAIENSSVPRCDVVERFARRAAGEVDRR